jgi:4-hydroxy-tetrahydrodipicolinate synthase
MLTRDNLRGVWVSAPTVWDAQGQFDEKRFRANIRRYAEAGLHGIWIAGSSGEFQSLDWNAFQHITTAFIDEVNGRTLTIVGCSAVDTAEAIRRTKFAQSAGADGVINALPFFVPLRADEAYQYFADVAEACPDIGLAHYNTLRAGVYLSAKDYARLAAIPNFVGSKQVGSDWMHFMELMRLTPQLAHMPVDGLWIPAMLIGGRGVWSAVAMWNPSFMLEAYELACRGNWSEALQRQFKINAFLADVAQPLVAQGFLDPVVDKAMCNLTGFTDAGDPRQPFLPMPQQWKDWARERIERDHGWLLNSAEQ